jgi:hypothetical protein
MPPGLSLTSNVLSGTPTTSGTFNFSLTARDSLGGTVTNAYTLQIANPPIIVQPTSLSSGQVGSAYSQLFTATGGNGGPYTFSIAAAAPFGLNFTPSTATLSGTPTSFGTNTNVTISATDGTLTGSRTYTLTVIPAGLTLTPTSTLLPNGIVNTPYSLTFAASGGTGNYTITLTPSAPAGLNFSTSGASATLSGKPAMSGSFPLSVQLADGNSTITRNYTLAISAPSLVVLTSSLPAGTQFAPYGGSLSASGGTAPYTWSTSPALPDGLMLNAATGAITGSPTGFGTTSFTATATDAAGSTASTKLSITVAPAPLTFTTTSPLPPAMSGVQYSASFGASGGIGPYTFSLGFAPPGFTMSGSTISGKLTNTTSSTIFYNVNVTVSDSNGASIGAGFQIPVQPAAATLILSAASLGFSAVSGGPAPSTQYVSVSSTNQVIVPFTVQSDSSWLAVTPGAGTHRDGRLQHVHRKHHGAGTGWTACRGCHPNAQERARATLRRAHDHFIYHRRQTAAGFGFRSDLKRRRRQFYLYRQRGQRELLG